MRGVREEADALDGSLSGKVALVSGAGSSGASVGNGRATSILLARRGARVVLADADPGAAAETLRLVTEVGGTAVCVTADATVPEDCSRAVDVALTELGGLDILVNNVGIIGAPGTAVDVDLAGWEAGMSVNVTSMVLMARHAVPVMTRSGGGAIVNISSVSGISGGHPNLLYPTSKSAVVGLTRAMAAHHGRAGVRVNCVAAGMVYTPLVRATGMTDRMRAARRDFNLLGTEGTAWDVAAAVAFLASDQARWITGAVLPVDGGQSAAQPAKPAPG